MTENNENEMRLGKVLVDDLKAKANDCFWDNKARDLREQISSIEFTCDYYQFQLYCLNKKRTELIKEYRKLLGLEVSDESVKAKA